MNSIIKETTPRELCQAKHLYLQRSTYESAAGRQRKSVRKGNDRLFSPGKKGVEAEAARGGQAARGENPLGGI